MWHEVRRELQRGKQHVFCFSTACVGRMRGSEFLGNFSRRDRKQVCTKMRAPDAARRAYGYALPCKTCCASGCRVWRDSKVE